MSEMQAHQCMTLTVNLTFVQCEFHTAKKLALQEPNQLIGIKMPNSGFSRNIWFLIPISMGGKCPFCPHCERPCDQ